MEDLSILVKFPTRGRADKFFDVFSKYHSMAKNPLRLKFIVSCDQDDEEMVACESRFGFYPNTKVVYGDSHTKIQAVNADIFKEDFDILLLASDDMIPIVNGYDQVIRDKMKCYFPDLDGVLWFNDGFKYQKLNTLSIMGKRYFDRFGYIYYPGYETMFADAEFTEVAIKLKKIIYFDQVIIQHQHPDYGFCEIDDLYKKNGCKRRADMILYEKRKKNNFDLEVET